MATLATAQAAQAVNLQKTYGAGQATVRALADVSVTFERARFTAVMGPSGSGKSTLMHCMAGLDRPTSGQAYVGGEDIGELDDAGLTRLRRDRIGFVFQYFNLVPTLTAAENITLPTDLAGRKADREWLDFLVEKLGLADRLAHRPAELSGGQQQRVACARALINKPDLVFADEPTGNLDSNASADLLAFLRWSVTESGQSIVMVTHDPRAAAYADRVVFLADGAVVSELSAPTADSVLERMRTLGLEMRKVTLRGLLSHKLRLALTALAIVLGVTFISGTFVLTDTLNSTFSTLFSSVYAKIDFQVRGVAQFGSGESATRNPLPESVLARVQGAPGVAGAYGEVEGYAQFLARDGKPISSTVGTVGVGWDTDQRISSLHLIAGRPPTTSDDVVMDAATAQNHGFSVGQRVRILTAGLKSAQTFTITGIAQFGTADNLAGQTLAAFALPTAQRVLGETGQFDFIDVVATPGADKAAVRRAIARALPSDAEVVTGQTIIDEDANAVSQALSFFNTALLVFALISLFVGAFTIYNTFSIIVGQRTRELALLRVVGASRGQILRSVLTEAAIVGFVSSAIGVGLGVLAAIGLEALLSGFGASLPTGPLTFEPRTAIVGLLVGTLVTVVSAIGPARNAVRIPPVAALTDRPSDGAGAVATRRRLVSGTALTVFGVALLAIGLAKPVVALVGAGALCIFVGVAMLAPAIARPLSSALGRPLAALLGTAGQLGRENSMRSPRRTAQTASALMVGLALVSAIAVFGASLSESATSSVDQAISADLLVSANGSGQLSDSVPATAAAVSGVTSATTVYRNQFEFRSTLATLTGVTPQNLAATVILRMTAGSAAALGRGELLIDSTTAKTDHLFVGDTVPVRFAYKGSTTIRIGGIYQSNALIQSYLVSSGYFLAHFSQPHPGAVLLRTDGRPGVETAVSNALAPYADVQVQTTAQFEQAQVSSVNQLLGLVYALLALAVLIALIGIVNTLMLSVLERTREIGLLRAVGMRRRQVRAMIRSEAVILATFGALIGIVIGTLMGLALVSALRQQGVTETSVPWIRLVEFLILAGVLGLVAASWPARRAARLDVLDAIAAQ